MQTILQDLRYGARMLLKTPTSTLIAIVTLALGIGANTAIFSVINAALIRSLPFAEANRLVMIWQTHPDIPRVGPAFPDFEDWRAQSQSFQKMEVYSFRRYGNSLLTGYGDPVQIRGALASSRLFIMLGASPILGRFFRPEEEKPGADRVVILSRSLWLRHFAGAQDVIGKNIQLNGDSFTIIGVIGEQHPPEIDCWLPLSQMEGDDFTNRMNHPISVIGRLKPGVSIDQARREMQAIAERLQQLYPASNKMEGVELVPLRDQLTGNLRTVVWLVFAAFVLILLIACANVSNLILARSAERQREMALRAALGAGRGRMIRQLLTESLMLAGLGGITGLILASWVIPALRSSLLGVVTWKIPGLETIGIDWYTLVFAFGISLLTGILFGTIPALLISRIDLNQAMKDGGKRGTVGARRNLSQALVMTEVALAVVVLVGSVLLVRSLHKLLQVDPGFRADHLLSLKIELPLPQYQKDEQVMSFYQRLVPRLLALPGVQQTAVIDRLPFAPSLAASRFVPEDRPVEPGHERIVQMRAVDHRFFEMVRIPLLHGRLFNEKDINTHNTLHSGRIIINETMARNFFPDRSPIGKRLRSDWGATFLIIGIVADIKDLGLDAPVEPELYFPAVARESLLLIRTTVDPPSLASAVQQAVISAEPIQPRYEARSVEELLSISLAGRRFSVVLLALSASLALILAAIGIYGVIAYSVTQRIPEIGVRMALGAQPDDVLRLVISQGMRPALSGIVIGLGSALALTRWMKTFLFGVSATDPMTFAMITLLLFTVALLACWIPARRATKVDPITALRFE